MVVNRFFFGVNPHIYEEFDGIWPCQGHTNTPVVYGHVKDIQTHLWFLPAAKAIHYIVLRSWLETAFTARQNQICHHQTSVSKLASVKHVAL